MEPAERGDDAHAESQETQSGEAEREATAIELVVGLGASAGGIEALEAFFSELPEADGLVFVVILHLDPDKDSHLAEVLQQSTTLPVQQVTETVRMEAGCIYVIPPSKNLEIHDGTLHLTPIEDERRRRAPVDHFFRTLAQVYRDHGVGIILSGTGANGSVGVGLLKENGGLVLVQDPEEAKFDEMPRNALHADVADLALSVHKMGPKLIEYRNRRRQDKRPHEAPASLAEDGVQAVRKILVYLRTRTGHDFSHYKRATVLRRLDRRLHITGSDDFDAYLQYLQQDDREPEALLKDLLISVTNFFRDEEAFEVLEEKIIPKLFEDKSPGDEIRIWIPGCATGEEAYSIAMLLAEYAEKQATPPLIQVFATDLNEDAIRGARERGYPESIKADVSQKRLDRFFENARGRYRVSEHLRKQVVFAPHSLLNDPPFSRLDLISCRNLLIYLQSDLQRKILDLFHYALRPGGYLFLGTSESIDGSSRIFRTEHKEARIFQRLDVEMPMPPLPLPSPVPFRSLPATAVVGRKNVREPSAKEGRHAQILQRLQAEAAPPGLLMNEHQELVRLTDAAAPFLQVPGGTATQNVLRLVRPELAATLQAAIFQSQREERRVETKPVRLEGETFQVRLYVRHLKAEGLVHVTFERVPQTEDAVLPPPDENGTSKVLHDELMETKEQLQLIIEEYETSREELRAQNEELQSINEEMRSTAEELETSKEEAQSVAEELQTVNDELEIKVRETVQAKSDLENLITSTEIATLFLDRHMKIQRFTPRVREHFHILSADLGRPLADLSNQFEYKTLLHDAEAVLETAVSREKEIRGKGDDWFLVRIRPYRSVETRIEGVVITFIEITAQKHLQEHLRQAKVHAEQIIASIPEPLLILTSDLRVEMANESFYEHFRVKPEFTEGHSIYDLGNGQWDGPALRNLLDNVLPNDESFIDYEVTHSFEEIGERTMLLSGCRLDEVQRILISIKDITARKQIEEALQRNEERYRLLVESATEYAILMLNTEGQITMWSTGAERIFGYTEDDVLGGSAAIIFTAEDQEAGVPVKEMEIARTYGHANDDRWQMRKDGARFWANGVMEALRKPDGSLHGYAKVLRDSTHRKQAEEALRESEERYRAIFDTVGVSIWEEDFSKVKVALDSLKDEGISDLRNYLEANPTVVEGMRDLVLVRDVNESTLRMYRAERKEDLMGPLRTVFLPEARPVFVSMLMALAQNESYISAEVPFQTLQGDRMVTAFTFTAVDPPRYSKVLVSLLDITERQRAEDDLRTLNETLEERVNTRTEEVRELMRALTMAEQEERQRIAQILHDDLQQQLYGLGMVLDMLRNPKSDSEAHNLSEQADHILEKATDVTRQLSSELSPPVLRSGDLEETLQWLALRKKEVFDMNVEIEMRGKVHIPEDNLRVLLYQALRELLFNVIKHAGVLHAHIIARVEAGEVVVTVEDGGKGFDPAEMKEQSTNGGFGLPNVQKRLQLIGGRIDVESAPGDGTRVTLAIPLSMSADP